MVDRYKRDVLPTKSNSMQQNQWTHLNWWKDKLGNHLLSDVTPSLIAEHRDLLLREVGMRWKKRSPASVVRYMAALSHAYTIAMFAGVTEKTVREGLMGGIKLKNLHLGYSMY